MKTEEMAAIVATDVRDAMDKRDPDEENALAMIGDAVAERLRLLSPSYEFTEIMKHKDALALRKSIRVGIVANLFGLSPDRMVGINPASETGLFAGVALQ